MFTRSEADSKVPVDPAPAKVSRFKIFRILNLASVAIALSGCAVPLRRRDGPSKFAVSRYRRANFWLSLHRSRPMIEPSPPLSMDFSGSNLRRSATTDDGMLDRMAVPSDSKYRKTVNMQYMALGAGGGRS